MLVAMLLGPLSVFGAAAGTTVIVRAKTAEFAERLAAKEIRRYLYLRTGELLPIVISDNKLPQGFDLIVVGRKDRRIVRMLTDKDIAPVGVSISLLDSEQYQLRTVELDGHSVILIAGGDSIGTLYGAYRFVEQFGVRFYLHGDTIPDGRVEMKLPKVAERGTPLFELRGIQPFHDFPEGPDWWDVDDYKAVMGQLAKLRMNFIGLHTYPEGGNGPEPTVWIGLAEDVKADGRVKFSYRSSYANSLRGMWGYAAKKTGDYSFGAAQLFERDDYGPAVMAGMVPFPETAEQQNELFNRTGDMLKDAFTYAHALGIKTCVGTETPLAIPKIVKAHIRSLGKNPSEPSVIEQVYEGMFERIMKAYPVDYYWLWTPEGWTWRGAKDEDVLATQRDLLTAVGAARDVAAPFKLATCGWVLGPPKDRTQFDRVLAKDVAFSCINRNVGFSPVEPNFAHLEGRGKWAIPWMEDDPALTIAQLWAGRMRADAADALKYGCTGLMGIHWRTRILGPNVSALAQAAWDQNRWKTPVQDANQRDMPVGDFYRDWAVTQFGPEAAAELAALFCRLDGGPLSKSRNDRRTNLPRPATWANGPGGLKPDPRPWQQVSREYAFVDEMAGLRSRIKGAGNLERFDYWLNNFRYMRAVAKTNCTWARFNRIMKKIRVQKNAEQKKRLAIQTAIPIRRQLVADVADVQKYLLSTITTKGGMGNVMNWQQHLIPKIVTDPAKELAKILGEALPADAIPWKRYDGAERMYVPTVRSSLMQGEDLRLKIIVLGKRGDAELTLYRRQLGEGEYRKLPVEHVGRGVYSARLSGQSINGRDFEYYIEAKSAGGSKLHWPVTAPERNQTVVVTSAE